MVDDRDRHVRRDGDDYAVALSNLLPQGLAWSREPDSVLQKVVGGLAQIFGFVDHRAATLLEVESDPRTTLEMLDSWERAWGLPDTCLAEPLTVADRQKVLVHKITYKGGQSRQFFIDLAASIGYEIEIREYSPWMFGVSEFGETDDGTGTYYPRWEIGAPEMRFYWTIWIYQVRLTWWRFGSAELGVDPHLRIGLATDLECILRRYKPAQTEILFNYSELGRPLHPRFNGRGSLSANTHHRLVAQARFSGESTAVANTLHRISKAQLYANLNGSGGTSCFTIQIGYLSQHILPGMGSMLGIVEKLGEWSGKAALTGIGDMSADTMSDTLSLIDGTSHLLLVDGESALLLKTRTH